jgi:arginase
MVGVREIDSGEQNWLNEGKINCMKMDEVRERGLATCMRAAVDTANQGEAGFGLTIDIDVIDPSEAPFVATPVNGGLSVEECAKALSDLPHKDRLLGMEVVEFTPRDDSEPNDAQNASELIVSFVKAVTGVAVKPTI